MTSIELLEKAKQLKAIADVGLLYCKNEYDKERYEEIQEISLQLLHQISGHDIEALKTSFPIAVDYPTAKVDVRGLVLSPDRNILLVQERADGRWSLPGGWADVGYSPKEVIVKECKEETGLDVVVQRLLALFDKRLHPHPPQPFYVYKLVFYCEAVSANITKGFDVQEVRYFAIDALPQLSEDRILKSQIEMLYKKAVSGDNEVYVD
jgi:ADP-ribose pyrophosphatase YjhB (NUDIX family)